MAMVISKSLKLLLIFKQLTNIKLNNIDYMYSLIKKKIKVAISYLLFNYFFKELKPLKQSESLSYIEEFDNIFIVGGGFDIDQFVEHSPKASFYVFEPNPNNYKLLKIKLKKQGVNFKIFNVAIGNENTKSKITLNGLGSSLNSFDEKWVHIKNSDLKKVTVNVRRLEDFLNEKKIIFKENQSYLLALDTEGYEFNVLKGTGKYLSKFNFIICESRIIPSYKQSYSFDQLIEFLNANNFFIGLIAEVGNIFAKKHSSKEKERRFIRYIDVIFYNKKKNRSFFDNLI